MRLPLFSRFWTFKPDRTRAALRPLRCCYFQGSGGGTDGLSDLWPTPPAHTTHWQAQRSHQDKCELDSADVELEKKRRGWEQEAPRRRNFISVPEINYFMPLFRSPAATGPGGRTGNTEFHLTSPLMTHHLAFRALTDAILIKYHMKTSVFKSHHMATCALSGHV